PEVASLAAKVIKPQQVKQLRQHLHDEHEALHAGRDSEAIMLSALFHTHLAEISGHSILAGFVGDLLPRSSLIISLYWERRETTCQSDAHHALVDAIEDHRSDDAAALMKTHILDLLAGLNLERVEKEQKRLSDILR
ncbi:FCD domain-containing protein, partial [Brucella anthropi]